MEHSFFLQFNYSTIAQQLFINVYAVIWNMGTPKIYKKAFPDFTTVTNFFFFLSNMPIVKAETLTQKFEMEQEHDSLKQ